MNETVPTPIINAVAALWKQKLYPSNRFESPQFLQLKAACVDCYDVGGQFWFSLSLWEILKSLGCPVLLPKDQQHLSLPPQEAAEILHRTLTAKVARVLYLCPLDWADDLPNVSFGGNRLGQFSSEELQTLADAPRIARAFPKQHVDWRTLSQFHWLIVEECLPVTDEPGGRTNPFMFQMMGDLGAIEAHEAHYPEAVERALFLLLLAPWEDWSEAVEVDWRGFRIPWVYSISDDLCVSLKTPPVADTLTLVPNSYTAEDGEQIEYEEPGRFNTADEKIGLVDVANDPTWEDLATALQSPLFAAPVRHFLVRAYYAQGIDEFIAHLTVIEAALGLQSDYGKKPKGDPRRGRPVTEVMAERVSFLLSDARAGSEYEQLFDIRSAYVHGRPMAPISSVDRFRARRLARRVVVALVSRALHGTEHAPKDREGYLVGLR